MPIASFLVAHSHGRNFFVKREGTAWCETNILRNLEKIWGGHGILYRRGTGPSCPPPICACSQLLQCSPNGQNLTP